MADPIDNQNDRNVGPNFPARTKNAATSTKPQERKATANTENAGNISARQAVGVGAH
jgi:hypothetical protein